MSSKSKNKISSVEGMQDILPQSERLWKVINEKGKEVSELHDFHLMETPVFEQKSLYDRAYDEDTLLSQESLINGRLDTVDSPISLRPDGKIPVMRSYLENQLGYYFSPLRAYYHGPAFRKDRDNKENSHDRFHEWGFEIIGDGDPIYDVEIVSVMVSFLEALQIKDPVLRISAVGCKSCRPKYKEELKDYYRYRTKKLCEDCSDYFKESPIKLLTCEVEECGELQEQAPIIFDHLCDECNEHFKELLELIEDNDVNYVPDPYVIGELGFYSRVAFKVSAREEGEALGYGGRFDNLARSIGNRSLESVGGSFEIEKIIKELKERDVDLKSQRDKRREVFFIAVGRKARKSALSIMNELRNTKIVVMEALGRETLEKQLKYAKKSGAPLSLIYGRKEVFEESVLIREMDSGNQESVLLDDMLDEVRKRL
ncbi:MAG: histidine--tRNA ligase [Candidatus Magasanikbacteria bacterium]